MISAFDALAEAHAREVAELTAEIAELRAANKTALAALHCLNAELNKPGVPMHHDRVQTAIERMRSAIAKLEGR